MSRIQSMRDSDPPGFIILEERCPPASPEINRKTVQKPDGGGWVLHAAVREKQ